MHITMTGECEFFSIHDGYVHITGYLWNDCEPDWKLTEFTFCLVPVREFIENYAERGMDYVNELEQDVKQYEQRGLSLESALNIYINYADHMLKLDYGQITENTPEGNYKTS